LLSIKHALKQLDFPLARTCVKDKQGWWKVVKREEARRSKTRRAEVGVGFLGRGPLAPSPPARGSGGAVQAQPLGFGAKPRPKLILVFLILQKASTWESNGI